MIKTIESKAFGEEVFVGKLIYKAGACSSMSEARRLIKQGAVDIDGEKAGDTVVIFDGSILRVGKRFWRELCLPPKKLTFEKHGNSVKILKVEK